MCECVCVCAAWVRLFAFDPHLDFDFRLPTHSRGIKDYFHQKQPTGRWRKTIKHRRRIRNENQWIDVIRRNNEYFNQLRCGVSNQLSNPIMHELSRLIKRLKCFDCFFFHSLSSSLLLLLLLSSNWAWRLFIQIPRHEDLNIATNWFG